MKTTNMSIHIRAALPQDASFVAPLICDAMGDLIHKFTNGMPENAIVLFEHFFQMENNQYSYQNCQIALYEGISAGMILTYDGGKLSVLREPFLNYLQKYFQTNLDAIEDETQAGELYIDCLAVLPVFRGKSIGSALINAAIEKSKQLSLSNTGLIVDLNNENALRLYEYIGFKKMHQKAFAGGTYWHMQYANE